jgi:hypothetical protein
MSQVYVGNGSGGGGGGGITSVEGTAPIEVNGVSGVPQTGAVIVSTIQPDLHVARFIVSAGGAADGANYTTLASAYAAAVAAGAPQTIFIQPGTYIENITLSAGINIAAFECDAMTPNVTIVGTLTATYSGNCSISGINLETNSANILVMSGSNGTELSILNCYFTISNATAFNLTNSNSGSVLNLAFCHGDISSTGIALYSSSFSGSIQEDWCKFTNSGNSTTASTFSAGGFQTRSGYYNNVFEFTGSGACDFNNSVIYTTAINTTPLIVNSTSPMGGNNFFYTRLDSGNAVGMTIGAGATVTMLNCSISSNNGSSSISGSGTLLYTPISFFGTQNTVTVSTQTALTIGPNIFPVDSGTTGQVWTSNGPGVVPSFQSFGGFTPDYFSAYLSSPLTNVTGDNSFIDILFDTTLTNTGNYSTTTGIYTAPATGIYCFQCNVNFLGGDSLTTAYRIYWDGSVYSNINTSTFANAIVNMGEMAFSASITIPMNIGEGMKIACIAFGTNKNVTIYGGTPLGQGTYAYASAFSGFRVS